MITTSTELICPRGRDNEPPIVVDLKQILISEVRQDEVAFVTPQKAPELLAEYNRAWRELDKIVKQLEAEKNKATKEATRRKGLVILEEAPRILREKGLESTADTRQAVLALDPEYDRLTDRVDQIKAIIEFLKGKRESFQNAYASVKKIMGEDAYNMSGRSNPNLSGGITESTERRSSVPGMGRSR